MYTYIQAYTHTHARTHAYTNEYVLAYTHASSHAYSHASSHAYTHAYTHAYMHTHTLMCAHGRAQNRVRVTIQNARADRYLERETHTHDNTNTIHNDERR